MADLPLSPSRRVIEFTERDIRLILCNLSPCDIRRRELLPRVLKEWVAIEVREYFDKEAGEIIDRRISTLESAARAYNRLADLLGSLDDKGRIALTSELAGPSDAALPAGDDCEETARNVRQELDHLRHGAVAARNAAGVWKRKKGQPRNTPGYLILQDLAAMFEWLTGTPATRRVDRIEGADSGPFSEFAAAVWPVVFGSDDGLSNQTKRWAAGRSRYSESSALIANLALRYPEWGLFDE
jgi:hypothetical protein